VAEILIRRCTLRVVRRGGWSWGEDPKRLVREVVSNLPALLAQKLAALLPDKDEQEFAADIRLRMPVRMSELSGEAATGSDRHCADDSQSTGSFEQRLDTVIRVAFGLGAEPERETGSPDRFARAAPIGPARSARVSVQGRSALQRLLLGWVKETVLEARLAALSGDQIAAWHDALLREVARGGVTAEAPDLSLAANIDAFVRARAVSLLTQTPTDRLRQSILVACEAAEQLDLPLTHFLLWQALDRLLSLERPPPPSRDRSTEDSATAMPDAKIRVAPTLVARSRWAALTVQDPPRYAASVQSSDWDIKIDCALPFLLLGPLTRLGYVAALTAVLEGADLTDEAQHWHTRCSIHRREAGDAAPHRFSPPLRLPA
jgi:hypothetical protein